jgi:protein-disulfide isomerase
MGVQSTPSFIINGKAIVGAQPFEAFQQAIESLLNP